MVKHTKGPWEVNEDKLHPWIVECNTDIPKIKGEIAVVGYKPNAYLIASAPDLLEACKKVYVSLQERGEVNLILRQAIAKAEGIK